MLEWTGYVLVRNGVPCFIPGLETGNRLGEYNFFTSWDDADEARNIEVPLCGDGCCYHYPYISCKIGLVTLRGEVEIV